jgi:hypothetical protein
MKKVKVTDHAVLRYVERKLGIDVEKIRSEMVDAASPAHRAGAVACSAGGMSYILKNGFVVTVVPGRRTNKG